MTDQAPVTVDSVVELLEISELDGVEMYAISGRDVTRPEGEFDETYSVKAALDVQLEHIRTRFTMTFEAKTAQYEVDLAMRYRLDKPAEVPHAIVIEFIERVGIMAAWPFLREQIFDIANRLGNPIPVLGLMRQGMFTLTQDPSPETASVEVPAAPAESSPKKKAVKSKSKSG